MTENADILDKARAALAGRPGYQGPVLLIQADKGVHRGLLALSGGKVLFLKDRFGRIEIDEETELGSLGTPSVRKGFMGWEFRAARSGSEVKYSRLSEEHAAALVEACKEAARALPAPDRPSGSPAHDVSVDPNAVSAAPGIAAGPAPDWPGPDMFGQADFFFGETGDESVPMARLADEPPARTVPAIAQAPNPAESGVASAILVAKPEDDDPRSADERPETLDATLVAEPAFPDEAAGSGRRIDRRFLIARIQAGVEPSPACAEAIRQVSELSGATPSAPEAADFLIYFAALGKSAPGAAGSAFGTRLAIPLLALADDRKLDPAVRVAAFKALGALCSSRLLSFLLFHGGRERDPAVLGAIFDAISLTEHESSLRFLVGQVKLRRAPISGLARESLSRTRWVGAAVALSPGSGEWDDDERLDAAACARILRLPGAGAPDFADKSAAAAAFREFRGSNPSDDPFKLLRVSVEANIRAIQSHDSSKSLEAYRNLLDLTDRFESENPDSLTAEERDPAGWVAWWAVAKARNPNTWLDAEYIDALGLPVPLSGKPGARASHAGVPSHSAGEAVKPGEKVARALLAGVVSGAAYWALLFGPARFHEIPHEYRGLLPFVLVAVAGPLVWGKAGWALLTAALGVAGLLPQLFADMTGFGHYGIVSALYWSALSIGFFRARKSKAGFFPAALAGAGIFFGYTILFNMLFDPLTVPSWVNVGMMAAFFWFLQFIPLTRQQIHRD